MLNNNEAKRLLGHSIFEHVLLVRFFEKVSDHKPCSLEALLEGVRSEFKDVPFEPVSLSSVISQMLFTFCFCKDIFHKHKANGLNKCSALDLKSNPIIRINRNGCMCDVSFSDLTIIEALSNIRNALSHPHNGFEFDNDSFELRLCNYSKKSLVFEMRIKVDDMQTLLIKLQTFWLGNI